MEALRARRRRDKRRMKQKAIRVYSRAGTPNPHDAKLADHITCCSGPCCGNPRKWFGELTMQERRHVECLMPG